MFIYNPPLPNPLLPQKAWEEREPELLLALQYFNEGALVKQQKQVDASDPT